MQALTVSPLSPQPLGVRAAAADLLAGLAELRARRRSWGGGWGRGGWLGRHARTTSAAAAVWPQRVPRNLALSLPPVAKDNTASHRTTPAVSPRSEPNHPVVRPWLVRVLRVRPACPACEVLDLMDLDLDLLCLNADAHR